MYTKDDVAPERCVNGAMVALSDQEREAIAAGWNAEIPTPSQAAIRQIQRIERETPFTHRYQRELPLALVAIFTVLRDKINALDAELAALNNRQPAPLPVLNMPPAISTIQAVEAQIATLRGQIQP